MTDSRKNKLSAYISTDPAFYRKAFLIFFPILIQSIIDQGVNMMDTVMVGQLGEVSISASSLANQYYMLFQFLCMGISASGLVLSSQYWGAGERESVHRVYDLMMQLISALAILFALVTWFLPSSIMQIYTGDADVIREGAGYLRVTAFVFLLHGTSLVMCNIMRAVGNARIGLYSAMISFFVNIGANYVFIFGKWGFPRMGVTGAAVGTLIARAVEFIVCFTYVFVFEKSIRYRPAGLLVPPGRKTLSEFRRLGLPAVISDFLLGMGVSAVSVVLGHLGKEVVSANSIVQVVDRMTTIAITGASSAAGVVIGNTVGEGDLKRAKKEGWTFLLLGSAIGLIGSVIVLTAGEWTIGFFGITAQTRAIAVRMMRISAVIVFSQATQSILSKGILRGGGDTQFLMIADILFQWCASVPLGFLAGYILHWPPEYVLFMLRIDYIIKTVWLIIRMKSGKWIHKAKKI